MALLCLLLNHINRTGNGSFQRISSKTKFTSDCICSQESNPWQLRQLVRVFPQDLNAVQAIALKNSLGLSVGNSCSVQVGHHLA